MFSGGERLRRGVIPDTRTTVNAGEHLKPRALNVQTMPF